MANPPKDTLAIQTALPTGSWAFAVQMADTLPSCHIQSAAQYGHGSGLMHQHSGRRGPRVSHHPHGCRCSRMHASGAIQLKRWMKQEQQFDKLTSEFIFR